MSVEIPNDMAIQAKTTAGLNLRKGGSTSYPIITVIPKGSMVTITSGQWAGEETDWYPVKWGSFTGWVSGAYLEVDNPAGTGAKVTELQALDNLFTHYGEPYLWGRNDCSQFVVNRWRDWGYAPEDGFKDAESDRMFDNFRNGVWAATKQTPATATRLALAFYTPPDQPNTAKHVQFVLWPGTTAADAVGMGENGGNALTDTVEKAKARDARSKVSPVAYNPTLYILGGIWLPDYRFKP